MRIPIVLLLGLLACSAGPREPAPNGGGATTQVTARPMPAFSLSKLEGGTLSSQELANKPLMVNFWHPE